MATNRREFLKKTPAALAFFAGVGAVPLTAGELLATSGKVSFRFAVASDGHFGQVGTSWESFFAAATKAVNDLHRDLPIKLCVINGDIIHDDPGHLPLAKEALDRLNMKYLVTRGNHDMVTEENWEQTWGQPLNQTSDHGDVSLVLCDTSNEKGEYLCPDLDWLKTELDKRIRQKHIFLFLHIPQVKWTQFSIESLAFSELVLKYPNISAIFHGHEHNEDSHKMLGAIPCFFDSHFGGNWGTGYHGFRMVEVMADKGFVTWIMNPDERLNEFSQSR